MFSCALLPNILDPSGTTQLILGFVSLFSRDYDHPTSKGTIVVPIITIVTCFSSPAGRRLGGRCRRSRARRLRHPPGRLRPVLGRSRLRLRRLLFLLFLRSCPQNRPRSDRDVSSHRNSLRPNKTWIDLSDRRGERGRDEGGGGGGALRGAVAASLVVLCTGG